MPDLVIYNILIPLTDDFSEVVHPPRKFRNWITRSVERFGGLTTMGLALEGKKSLALNIESPLSVPRAAALIGISRIAAYKAIKEGRLGHTMVGNVIIVCRADAERYKSARRVGRGTRKRATRSSMR